MTAGVGAGVYHVATPSFVSLPRRLHEQSGHYCVHLPRRPHLYNGPKLHAQRQPLRHDPKLRLSVHTPAAHLAKAGYSSAVIGLVTS